MVCSGEGALARATLEEPLQFRIRYSANGVVLRCHVCLHCSTLTIRASGERGGGESGETLDCGGREARSKAARRPREPISPQAEGDAGFSPTSGSSSVASPSPSPMKMRPNTELACILADEFILLGSRVGIHSCSFESPSEQSHQSPS